MSKKNRHRLLWAEIDLGALGSNLRAIRRSLAAPSVEVLAVVKADAYGHGMLPVARRLWKGGVRFFGVANIDEAETLRQALPSARILTLGVFHPGQLGRYLAGGITPTVSSLEDARHIGRALKGRRTLAVHLKIDTGMGRLGLPHERLGEFLKEAGRIGKLRIEGVYTHFSSADAPSASATRRQLAIFERCLKTMSRAGFRPRYVHASNSMGVLRFKEAHFNLVRPGLLLYGLRPGAGAKMPRGIRPVLSWKTRVSFLKKFEPGQTVSYGRTHRVKRNTLIATLPVGYSHGYRVALSNLSSVLIGGRRCPVAGRVTMDQTLVDAGRSNVKRWDEAVLIGSQGRRTIGAEELAGLAGTIPYEIVCGIHPRVPRIYR